MLYNVKLPCRMGDIKSKHGNKKMKMLFKLCTSCDQAATEAAANGLPNSWRVTMNCRCIFLPVKEL